jgi:hypothetical protein
MTPQIDIDDELFNLLKEHAEPFVDTPNTVLRRLLEEAGSSAPVSNGAAPKAPWDPMTTQITEDPEHAAETESPRRRAKGSNGKPTRTRARKGSLLPETEYEMPILRYLVEHSGRAPSREVVEAVGEALADRLTPIDLEALSSGETRWKSRAAFARLRMIENGDLDGHAPRGTWEITDKGRARVKSDS